MLGDNITQEAEVLVIGGGIAGTFAALKAKEAGTNSVVQVDKGHVGKSGCSAFAAGIMYVPFPDDPFLNEWFASEVVNSGYLAQQDRVKDHFGQAFNRVQEMLGYGVEFLKTPDGKLERHPGRGKYPALMFPGPQLMDILGKASLKRGVKQVNKTMITDLLTRGSQVVGAVGFNIQTGDFIVFKSRATVLATGMTMYKGLAPGHRDCTGDGFAAAYRAGVVLSSADSDFSNFNSYPAQYDLSPGTSIYIGQGGILVNAKGERFMGKYDPVFKERVSLATLANAFALEVRQGNAPIYMNMRHFSPEQVARLRKVLPRAMRMFEKVGVVEGDKFLKPIEWMVTAPRGRAGILVNRDFASSLSGLFACGEAAAAQSYTNNLTCAATSGARAGLAAAEYARGMDDPSLDQAQVEEMKQRIFWPLERKEGMEAEQVVLALQEAIVPYDVLLLRHGERMAKALQEVENIRDNLVPLLGAYDPHYLRMMHEACNLVFVAELQLKSAILRAESRLTLREDYPYTDNLNWLKWINARQEGDKVRLSTEDVPIEKYPLKPPLKKSLNPMWQLAEKLGIVRIGAERVIWA